MVLRGHQAEPPRRLEHTPQCRQHLVSRARCVPLHEDGSDGCGVLVTKLVPGEGFRGAPAGGEQPRDDIEGPPHGAPRAGRETGKVNLCGMPVGREGFLVVKVRQVLVWQRQRQP